MALDHYVSQVHLRNFNSSDGYLHAIRKRDLKPFRTSSRSVCRIEDGNTNRYLVTPRLVEDEFLPLIEPKYNASVAKFRDGKIDREAIFSIAGFLAYVVTCSPTAMRTAVPFMTKNLEAAAKALDQTGLMPKAPASLGNKSMTELLEDGEVKFIVDPKFPQAMSSTGIAAQLSIFGNSSWEILTNTHGDSPFFTSDYPAAIEASGINTPVIRIVPLAPDVAVRIYPDVGLRNAPIDLTFQRFRARYRVLTRQEVRNVNQTIVRSAEDLVFFRDERDWVPTFVKRNSDFHVRAEIVQLPSESGFFTGGRLRVARRPPSTHGDEEPFDRAA
jgi:hypothetical protein